MGFPAKTNQSEGWGMGFLFIFFPEEEDDKGPNLSSSPSFKTLKNTFLKRSNSAHLLSKAQSTISICALLIFITLLLFTLSTFEPTSPNYHSPSRRHLMSKPIFSLTFPHALQGMGSLYSRGTRAMNDLIIAHVPESVTEHDLKLFLRLLYRSGITSKSDVLFLFPSKKLSFDKTIVEETNSFLKLVSNAKNRSDPTQFVISGKKEKESGEPIWGRKIRSNYTTEGNSTESTRLSYGSVVGFDVNELDPENSLAGFFELVSLNLRRWACYPMLLGRVRRNYKHVMLVDVKEDLILGDPLKNPSQESVIVTTIVVTKKRNSDKTHQKQANSGIIMGGAKGVRRLANTMLTEIVRVAMQHKKKNSVSESVLFNQLVGNENMLKNVNLIMSADSLHELTSHTGLNSKSGLIRRGNSNLDINSSVFRKYLCSSPLDSTVYSDCL